MDNETQKIFSEQLNKLPKEVIKFISTSSWSEDAEEIGSLYNLSEEEVSIFTREIMFVLVGLTHPDEFIDVLEKQTGIKGAVLEALAANAEKKIFSPVRAALLSMFEKSIANPQESLAAATPIKNEDVITKPLEELILPEAPVEGETFKLPVEIPTPGMIYPNPTAARAWEKAPEVIPDNLPTEETTESFMPNLIPKTIAPEKAAEPTPKTIPASEVHPFEEKMKKVFTAGQQAMGELTIEPAVPEAPKAPQPRVADPYREPIE